MPRVGALLSDGTVKCWGCGEDGRLGNNSTSSVRTPVTVQNLSKVKSLYTGHEHACATLEDFTIKCWGDAWYQKDVTDN